MSLGVDDSWEVGCRVVDELWKVMKLLILYCNKILLAFG